MSGERALLTASVRVRQQQHRMYESQWDEQYRLHILCER